MVLETVGTIQKGTMRLDLWNAESRGKVVTDKGAISFRTYVHAVEIAMVVEIECSEERQAQNLNGSRPPPLT